MVLQVGAGLEQVGGEAVPQGVDGDVLLQARGPMGPATRLAHGGGGERAVAGGVGEEPGLRSCRLPVGPEDLQEHGREHHVAILAALALTDAEDHALTIDVADAERGDLGDAEAGGVGGHERGAMLERADGGEEPGEFVGAEDDGEPLGLPGADEVLEGRGAAQGDVVEEAEGLEVEVVIAPGDMALLDQVEQEGADVLGPERLGGLAEVPGEACDAVDVDADGAGREVAEVHVLGHAEPERSHGVPPSGVEAFTGGNCLRNSTRRSEAHSRERRRHRAVPLMDGLSSSRPVAPEPGCSTSLRGTPAISPLAGSPRPRSPMP